jgi:hypothetical protein
MDQLSEQERQLIEIIREQNGNDSLELRLWFDDSIWRLSMSAVANGKSMSVSAADNSFDRAWDLMRPEALKTPSLRIVKRED